MRQQRKSAKARDKINQAAISCLAESGYAETSVQRIVDRAGISKGALQHHFPSKEDLIASVVAKLLDRALALTDRTRDDPDLTDAQIVAAELRSVWTHLIDTGSYRALLEILIAARTDGKLCARIEPMLHDYNRKLELQDRKCYSGADGDPDDATLLLLMNRVLLSGLIIQGSFEADPNYHERVVSRWIELISPLLVPRPDESGGTKPGVR